MTFLVELQAIDAHFAMHSWHAIASAYEMLVDAMIDNIPFVLARDLEDGIVGGAINLILGALLDDAIVLFVE